MRQFIVILALVCLCSLAVAQQRAPTKESILAELEEIKFSSDPSEDLRRIAGEGIVAINPLVEWLSPSPKFNSNFSAVMDGWERSHLTQKPEAFEALIAAAPKLLRAHDESSIRFAELMKGDARLLSIYVSTLRGQEQKIYWPYVQGFASKFPNKSAALVEQLRQEIKARPLTPADRALRDVLIRAEMIDPFIAEINSADARARESGLRTLAYSDCRTPEVIALANQILLNPSGGLSAPPGVQYEKVVTQQSIRILLTGPTEGLKPLAGWLPASSVDLRQLNEIFQMTGSPFAHLDASREEIIQIIQTMARDPDNVDAVLFSQMRGKSENHKASYLLALAGLSKGHSQLLGQIAEECKGSPRLTQLAETVKERWTKVNPRLQMELDLAKVEQLKSLSGAELKTAVENLMRYRKLDIRVILKSLKDNQRLGDKDIPLLLGLFSNSEISRSLGENTVPPSPADLDWSKPDMRQLLFDTLIAEADNKRATLEQVGGWRTQADMKGDFGRAVFRRLRANFGSNNVPEFQAAIGGNPVPVIHGSLSTVPPNKNVGGITGYRALLWLANGLALLVAGIGLLKILQP